MAQPNRTIHISTTLAGHKRSVGAQAVLIESLEHQLTFVNCEFNFWISLWPNRMVMECAVLIIWLLLAAAQECLDFAGIMLGNMSMWILTEIIPLQLVWQLQGPTLLTVTGISK